MVLSSWTYHSFVEILGGGGHGKYHGSRHHERRIQLRPTKESKRINHEIIKNLKYLQNTMASFCADVFHV